MISTSWSLAFFSRSTIFGTAFSADLLSSSPSGWSYELIMSTTTRAVFFGFPEAMGRREYEGGPPGMSGSGMSGRGRFSMRRPVAILGACLAAAALAAPSAAAATAEPPPPPGANVACTPTVAHPEPVILVHGTFENRFDNWQAMSPALKAAGYCVYALDYGAYRGSDALGIYGIGAIRQSAEQLRDYVPTVRA